MFSARGRASALRGKSLPRRPRVELLEARLLLASGDALTTPDPATAARIGAAYGQLPLSFEGNQGQTAAQVDYLSRGNGYTLFLTPGQAVLSLRNPGALGGDVIRMQLVGANAAPREVGLDQLPGASNYFIGNDPNRWHTDVANYARVEEQGVYPGVDLTYYGNQRQLEYDFTVAPGADPGVIRLAFQGAESMTLDAQGNLVLHAAGGDVVEHAPVLYQEAGGIRQAVSGHFVLGGDGQVGFAVGAYDTSKPLVIDPTLSYSTYLGGGSDSGNAIAVDAAGNAYVTGGTANFPTTPGAFQTALGGGGDDAFVAKLNAAGSALVYSTYLGGSGSDVGLGIAVDAGGNAYVTGSTNSFNFPTASPLQPFNPPGFFNAFVAKLNASGSALVYSTYLGGSSPGGDSGQAIAVDAAGNAYVTGNTSSTNFPTTPGAFQTASGGTRDAFVTKLNAAGLALVYSTYLGGSSAESGTGIAVDAAGNAYVTGNTSSTDFPTTPGAFQTAFGGDVHAFVTKLNATGSALVYSTNLGGSGNDGAVGIAVDAAGNAYVTGDANSTDFPTTPGAFQTAFGGGGDAFVAKLNAAGSALVYSTYLGGSGSDQGRGIAVDAAGNAYVTGNTSSTSFPTTPEAFQTAFGGGGDAFVAKLNAAGSALIYSTYLGGSGGDDGSGIAVDGAGNAYVTGATASRDFPTASPLQPANSGEVVAFIAKIAPGQALTAATTTTLTSSSNPSAPGQAVTFTAIVAPATGTGTPAGSVTFTVDGQAQTPVNLAVVNGVDQATFTTSTLTLGTHTITASYSGGGNFSSSTSTPPLTQRVNPVVPPVTIPPTVVGMQRFGFHAQPTVLVLSFSAAFDPARAEDAGNYRIVMLGGPGRGGSHAGHVIRVVRAVYDPAARTVTLIPAERLDIHNRYRLTVNGTTPGGLAGATGLLLDGKGNGVPGSNYVGVISWKTLVGSVRPAFHALRHWRAGASIAGVTVTAPMPTAGMLKARFHH